MDTYHIWCNLQPGVGDLEFAGDVAAYLDHLRDAGLIACHRLTRRKLGLGPSHLGEFHIAIDVIDLAQLERAFQQVAARQGETERLHARVYGAVRDVTFALYRDFPDPVRTGG
ncbi:MAG: hypothetical protein HY423_05730 [Candidatus Lambdaproteobacteria bacterium]|nr:hypothetical protein [Candidatus Lambdaproteobacteria bacterium]